MTPREYFSFARLRAERQRLGIHLRDVAHQAKIDGYEYGSGRLGALERDGDVGAADTPSWWHMLIWYGVRAWLGRACDEQGIGMQVDLEEAIMETDGQA